MKLSALCSMPWVFARRSNGPICNSVGERWRESKWQISIRTFAFNSHTTTLSRMAFILLVAAGFLTLDAWWFIRINRLLRACGARFLRAILVLFMAVIVLYTIFAALRPSAAARAHHWLTPLVPSVTHIWHYLVLPLAILSLVVPTIPRRIRSWRSRLYRWYWSHWKGPAADARLRAAAVDAPAAVHVSRRNFLVTAAATFPPAATFGLSAIAASQIGDFTIQPYQLAFKQWPRSLDGLKIAVVADVHVGPFSNQRMLDRIVEATNNEHADLILIAGDLINKGSFSDLPAALDMVARLDAPSGVHVIQGNHDVIEGASKFNELCRRRGFAPLLDEALTLHPRGLSNEAFQLLGTQWKGNPDSGIIDSVSTVDSRRRFDLFPILLSHHPHAWDEAQRRNLPLTLAGHTHGGQIMFTRGIGGGPLRFRYWTGLYQKGESSLIVSNGVGNWFPLRINAPPQIVTLTLRAARQAVDGAV